MFGLRVIRQERMLSQKELAKAAGFATASMSRYETVNRIMSVDIAKRLSKTLNTNWASLFDEQIALKD